jgi:hypothetical protein
MRDWILKMNAGEKSHMVLVLNLVLGGINTRNDKVRGIGTVHEPTGIGCHELMIALLGSSR